MNPSIWVILVLLAFPSSDCEEYQAPALIRAIDFLWSQQAADGGWHSPTYGILKGGQAHTPFILHTLLQVPDSIYSSPKEKIAKAGQFIRDHLHPSGALGIADPEVLEYPNYASSYALRLFSHELNDSNLAGKIRDYLFKEQFTIRRGIYPEDPAYGSWGFGETNLKYGQTGHLELSHTRKVLQALAISGKWQDSVCQAATAFLQLLQKDPANKRVSAGTPFDGGFYFSPTIAGINKGGIQLATDTTPAYFRSYATATCEGILAHLALGHSVDSKAVQAAMTWLRAHPELRYPEGIPPDDPAQWHKVMFFYHLWIRAETYEAVKWPGNWRDDVRKLIEPLQQKDGSFINPRGALNKENDPLLATAMAIDILRRTNR